MMGNTTGADILKAVLKCLSRLGLDLACLSALTTDGAPSMVSGNQRVFVPYGEACELPWPSGYELRLSLERSRVLILVKVIGGRQEGHPVQKCSLLQQSPN